MGYLLPTHMVMKGCSERLRRSKTIEHGTEMSDATMDLMIKYNAYYIPTFCRKFCTEKALIPNYYPAIVVPKALWWTKN
jgi:hypothetical protein